MMVTQQLRQATGFEAGISGDEQIRIVLRRIIARGGEAQMADLYDALEEQMRSRDFTLSDQGRASLRFFVNRVAVEAGYVYAHDKNRPGWRIAPEGREFAMSASQASKVAVNLDTGSEEGVPANAARGTAFEKWVLRFLRSAYPYYAWYHQGVHKSIERGLDFVGSRIGDASDESRSIGVQVKLHQASNAPTQTEWLKFLAGCFARRVGSAAFVTTGRLTGEQRREAQEAGVTVIEGAEELRRLAELHGMEPFDLGEGSESAGSG